MGRDRLKLIGQKFGDLTVIRVYKRYYRGGTSWRCECKCGNIVNAQTAALTSGSITQCAKCRKAEKLEKSQDNSHLIGRVFGYWKILQFLEKRPNHDKLFECECYCGNIRHVWYHNLTSGGSKSCGCKPRRNKDCRKSLQRIPIKIRAKIAAAQKTANKKHVYFQLSPQEFYEITLQPCYYCGIKPKPYGSVDRVCPKLGYTIDNCVSACVQCNRAKFAQTPEDLLVWVKKLISHQNKTKSIQYLMEHYKIF